MSNETDIRVDLNVLPKQPWVARVIVTNPNSPYPDVPIEYLLDLIHLLAAFHACQHQKVAGEDVVRIQVLLPQYPILCYLSIDQLMTRLVEIMCQMTQVRALYPQITNWSAYVQQTEAEILTSAPSSWQA